MSLFSVAAGRVVVLLEKEKLALAKGFDGLRGILERKLLYTKMMCQSIAI